MIEIREYRDRLGRIPFRDWFDNLDHEPAEKVTTALTRLALGNFSNVKGVGSGIFELRINLGPGFRIYFGKDADQIVILLGGGTKKRQQNDIQLALDRWADYKRRKTQRKEEA